MERRIDILFADDRLEKDCAARNIERRFGAVAEPLRRRLTALSVATVLADLADAPGRLEALTGNRKGQYSMRLTANWRLIFDVADDPVPTRPDGGIDLAHVGAVRILEVVDYHER